MFWSKSKKEFSDIIYDKTINSQDLRQLVNAVSGDNLEQILALNISSDNPLFPLVNNLKEYVKRNQRTARQALMDVNSRVERIVGISSIQEMTSLIKNQADNIDNMAAQSEEMSATSEEITATTMNVASFADQSLDTASHGVNKLKEAISLVDRSFSAFEETSKQVNDVLASMDEIKAIINLIANVADQTNLLALNAAIEAARAGEHGRGFAVVADEVRKLAEHTKSSVLDITKKMEILNQKSSLAAKNISAVARIMQEGKTIMVETGYSIKQIIENSQTISEDISQISVGNEEQSNTISVFSQNISELASSSQGTIGYANEAGQGVYTISQELVDLRSRRLNQTQDISPYDALKIAKTDYFCWVWRMTNIVLGYEEMDTTNLDTQEANRLDKWLQNTSGFEKLDPLHKRLLNLAREIVTAHNNREIAKAEQSLEQFKIISQEVIGILDHLQSTMVE